MTVPTSTGRSQYTANGVTTLFTYAGKLLAATDVKVYLDGVLQVSGYTVLSVGGDTSDIQFDVAPANGVIVTLLLDVPLTQTADYVEGDPFPAETHERALDKLTLICQQLKSTLSRALTFSATVASDIVGVITEAPVSGKTLMWDGVLGNVKNGPDAADIIAAGPAATEAVAAAATATEQAAIATAAAAGFKAKNSARAATTANITLSAPQTIDGVSVIAGDRVLVKNQSTSAQNGIYQVNAGAWTRTTDAASWLQLVSAMISVDEGTVNADTTWFCPVNAGGTIGVTAVTFSNLPIVVPDNSLTYVKTITSAFASLAELVAGTASKFVNAAIFKSWLDSTYAYVAPVTLTTGVALAQNFAKPAGITPVSFSVSVNALSTNGTSIPIIQLSDAGGPETTGYLGATDTVNVTQGASIGGSNAANVTYGTVYFDLVNAATNTWSWSFLFFMANASGIYRSAGIKSLSQPLSGFRVTTVGGSDQADSGAISSKWYG